MELQVIKIMATDNYELIIQYHTGEIKYINLKDEIFQYDCWKSLRDINIFKQVFVDDFGDGPCWPNHVDMNPIRIYNQSKSFEDLIKKTKVIYQKLLI